MKWFYKMNFNLLDSWNISKGPTFSQFFSNIGKSWEYLLVHKKRVFSRKRETLMYNERKCFQTIWKQKESKECSKFFRKSTTACKSLSAVYVGTFDLKWHCIVVVYKKLTHLYNKIYINSQFLKKKNLHWWNEYIPLWKIYAQKQIKPRTSLNWSCC